MIFGTALALCLVAACKKDNKKPGNTYLLQQQITDDTAEGIPLDTADYSYDDHNRVTTITDGSGQNKITFRVTYDGQSRVSTAKRFNYKGDLVIEYDFFYGGATGTGYYLSSPTHVADTASFVFNDNNEVAEIDTKHSGRTTFTYDSKGNVGSTQLYGADNLNKLVNEDAYAYDNMKNPFSQLPSGNLFLEYIVLIHNPSTLINNVANKDGDPFAYTYNSAGFPLTAVITLANQQHIKVYYSYIVK